MTLTEPAVRSEHRVVEAIYAFPQRVDDWGDAAALCRAATATLDALLGEGAARLEPRDAGMLAVVPDDPTTVLVLTPEAVWGVIRLAPVPDARELDERRAVAAAVAGPLGVALHAAAGAAKRTAADAATHRRLKEAATLATLSEGFVRGKDLTRVLQRVVDGTTELMNCEISTVLLRHTSLPVLEVVAATAGSARAVVGDLIPLDESLAGWVVRTGQPRMCMDPANEPLAYRPSGDRAGIRDHLIVPLRSDEGPIGVLTVSNRRAPGPFTGRDVELLGELARHAAAAIESSRVLDALQRKVAENAALSQVGRAVTGTLALDDVLALVVREAEALIGGACASVVLQTDDPARLRVAAATGVLQQDTGSQIGTEGSLMGWVVQHRETVVTENISDDPRTRPHNRRFGPAVAVPLVAGRDVCGALLVVRAEGAPSVSADDIAALEHLAAYAAIAIENARLHRQAEQALAQARARVDLLSALLEAGNRFRVEADPAGLLRGIADTVRERLRWRHVVITRHAAGEDAWPVAAAAGFDAAAGSRPGPAVCRAVVKG